MKNNFKINAKKISLIYTYKYDNNKYDNIIQNLHKKLYKIYFTLH